MKERIRRSVQMDALTIHLRISRGQGLCRIDGIDGIDGRFGLPCNIRFIEVRPKEAWEI